MPLLPSKKYPTISYEENYEIWEDGLVLEGQQATFHIDVEDTLVEKEDSIQLFAAALDAVHPLREKVKANLLEITQNAEHEKHELVTSFFDFHREELDADTLCEMLQVKSAENLDYAFFISKLDTVRFGTLVDEDLGGQIFIMDLSLHTDFTDELLVIYFDTNQNIVYVTHES